MNRNVDFRLSAGHAGGYGDISTGERRQPPKQIGNGLAGSIGGGVAISLLARLPAGGLRGTLRPVAASARRQ